MIRTEHGYNTHTKAKQRADECTPTPARVINSNTDNANTPTHAHTLYVNCNKNIHRHVECAMNKTQIEMEPYDLFI